MGQSQIRSKHLFFFVDVQDFASLAVLLTPNVISRLIKKGFELKICTSCGSCVAPINSVPFPMKIILILLLFLCSFFER